MEGRNKRAIDLLHKDDLMVIAGAGGFIGGSLAKYFRNLGFTRIRGVDKKPLSEWNQRIEGVESLCMDLSEKSNCMRVCADATEIYNLAADMGGIGFIEKFRIDCLRSILINTHMLEAAYVSGVNRYFFSSSACVYNIFLQSDSDSSALKESDAYPAMAERAYGWEKLISEMFCKEYWVEHRMKMFIARFHNTYGPFGAWRGGREKAPAAICRKIIEAKVSGNYKIAVWGDGLQTRSFTYIEDCLNGIDMIMHCDELIATPINLGSNQLVSIDELVSLVEDIANIKVERVYDQNAPKGVTGRNSDNTFIKSSLNWEPSTSLGTGMKKTYLWIEQQYLNSK